MPSSWEPETEEDRIAFEKLREKLVEVVNWSRKHNINPGILFRASVENLELQRQTFLHIADVDIEEIDMYELAIRQHVIATVRDVDGKRLNFPGTKDDGAAR